jgi:hypothetical protein
MGCNITGDTLASNDPDANKLANNNETEVGSLSSVSPTLLEANAPQNPIPTLAVPPPAFGSPMSQVSAVVGRHGGFFHSTRDQMATLRNAAPLTSTLPFESMDTYNFQPKKPSPSPEGNKLPN